MSVLSPRFDALGNTLAVLFDIATPEQRRLILRNAPVQAFGIPTVYPQSPGVPPYHNESVWPFVQAFWVMAAAEEQDETALLAGIAALARAAALFRTNKENFVLSTGDAHGTAVNSDRQLWSVAGMLAMHCRVLFGMRFELDGLHFAPFVPQTLAGSRTITGLRYRKSTLNLQVNGFGGTIRAFTIDGRPAACVVPADTKGAHTVVIDLSNESLPKVCKVSSPAVVSLDAPEVHRTSDGFAWPAIPGAQGYRVYRDGILGEVVTATSLAADTRTLHTLQLAAVAPGRDSFLSEPLLVAASTLRVELAPGQELEHDTGTDFAFVTVQSEGHNGTTFSGNVPLAGTYHATVTYANGSGPVNQDNRCAIRTLYVDGVCAGAMVMPQRGSGDWNRWGDSSSLQMWLNAGMHGFELRFDPSDVNMNGEVNTARVANLILTQLD